MWCIKAKAVHIIYRLNGVNEKKITGIKPANGPAGGKGQFRNLQKKGVAQEWIQV